MSDSSLFRVVGTRQTSSPRQPISCISRPRINPDQTIDDGVVVQAGETLALLLHAAQSNRAWLNDFADESMKVSRDLYEVLLQYKRIAVEESSRAA